MLVLCGFTDSVPGAITLLVVAMFFVGASQSGVFCVFLEVSPNYATALNSLSNVFGGILVSAVYVSFEFSLPHSLSSSL
jgi:hypothetical protein